MTKEEINRRVATEVMGLEIIKIGDTEYFKENPTFIWCQPAKTYKPAECIDHAWMVVERMNELQLDVTLEQCWNTGWGCQITNRPFGGPKELERHGYAKADTAPMAICLAALAAVNGEKGLNE